MSVGAAEPNSNANERARPKWEGKRYIIAYKESVQDRSVMADRIRQNGGQVHKSFRRFRGAVAELTAAQRSALAADPDVDYIEPDWKSVV